MNNTLNNNQRLVFCQFAAEQLFICLNEILLQANFQFGSCQDVIYFTKLSNIQIIMDLLTSYQNLRDDTPHPCLKQSEMQEVLAEQLRISKGLAQVEVRSKRTGKKPCICSGEVDAQKAIKEDQDAQKENESGLLNRGGPDTSGSTIPSSATLDHLKSQVAILKKLADRQQEEKLMFCYKYKQLYQRCLELMKNQDDKRQKSEKRDAGCQTEQSLMILANISASAINYNPNMSSFNQWGAPSHSQVLAQSQHSPVSQFIRSSTARTKVRGFDDDVNDVEEFQMRGDIPQTDVREAEALQNAGKQSKIDMIVRQKGTELEPGAAKSFTQTIELDIDSVPPHGSKVSEELQICERYSSRMGLTEEPNSMIPSQINFYNEVTQGEWALVKKDDLQNQEFQEKCKSDSIIIDEGRNSYLDHVRDYNRARGSTDSHDLSELIDTKQGAILVLDQQSARQFCDDQVSFSMVTKGELQKCIKQSRNTNGPREAPSVQMKQPSAYSNVLASTPARSPSRPCLLHLSQQKPERTCEQSLDLGSERKQQKLLRERDLRQKLREMVQMARRKEQEEEESKVFQSQILERALYCSSEEISEEESTGALVGGMALRNGHEVLDAQARELDHAYNGACEQPERNKGQKFTSYVTMLGKNVTSHGLTSWPGEPLLATCQEVQTNSQVPCSSRNSATIERSQAMHSLQMIQEQIEEEQRLRREANENKNGAELLVYHVKAGARDVDQDKVQIIDQDKGQSKHSSGRHAQQNSSSDRLNRQETSRTDLAVSKQAATKKGKESKVPVLEVDLFGVRKKKMEGDDDRLIKKEEQPDENEALRVKRKEQLFNKFKTQPADENDDVVNKGSPTKVNAQKPPVFSNHVKSPNNSHHPGGASRVPTNKQKLLTSSIMSKQSALNHYYRTKRHSRLGMHHSFITGRASILSGYRRGVNSVMNESPCRMQDDRLCGHQREADNKTMYTYQQLKDQNSGTRVNEDTNCSPQKCPRPPNIHGIVSPVTSAPRSSYRPSFSNLHRNTRMHPPSAYNQNSNQESLIFSPSKDFWKNKCQQLIYQKQKNAAEMIGQRERLDWCVREIERLKQVGNEKSSQVEEQQQKENIDVLAGPMHRRGAQIPQYASLEPEEKHQTKQLERENDNDDNHKINLSKLHELDDVDFELKEQDHQAFEIQIQRVEGDTEVIDRAVVGSSKETASIDLLCSEKLPNNDVDRSPPAFMTRRMEGSCLFPTSKGSSSRKLSPTTLHPSNVPSKVQSLTHSPRTPFDTRGNDQDDGEECDIHLQAKKIQRDQVKKQEQLFHQRVHYSHLKRQLNNESHQSAPDCSRNLQGLFDQAAQQSALEDQMNKLFSGQRSDESATQQARQIGYCTVEVGSRSSVRPLRQPAYQRCDSNGGLTGSKSINQMYGNNSMVASSTINTGSGTMSKTKTFCYQPVIRNNMQRMHQQTQSLQANPVQMVGAQLQSQKLGACNGVLQDASKDLNNTSQVIEGLRRMSGGQHHHRIKTNGGSDYWSSATHQEVMSTNAPCSKLTPHPKVFGVESQSLLYGKMQSNISSAKSKESKPRPDLTRSKENQEPRQSAIRPPSEFLSVHAKMPASFPGSRTESTQELNKNLSASRSFFEQIKLKSSKQNVRRADDRSQMDMTVTIPKERLSHDPKPEPQPLLHQKVITQDNPDLVTMDEERKKQRAPLTPCYPSIKKSLLSLKHASVLGDRKEQLFQNTAAHHQISCSYLLPEPHSATGCSKQYGSIKLQSQEQGRMQAASAFSYSREHLTAPNSAKNSGNGGRNSAQDPRRSPTSAGKQAYRLNFNKDAFKGEQSQKDLGGHHYNRSCYATISSDQLQATRGSYGLSQLGNHSKNDPFMSTQSKGLSRPFLGSGVPRPSQVQQLQMGPQGTSKPITRKTINNDSNTPTFNTTPSCSNVSGHKRHHLGRN